MNRFTDLDLIEPLQRALVKEGYEVPTEIQARTIEPLLDGRDVLGCAQTGTGKTAAFLLPILQHLDQSQGGNRSGRGRRPIQALILTPTRELAAQIGASAAAYGRYLHLRHAVIFGGTGEGAQIRALRAGLDLLVATPGRLLDLMGRGHIDLSEVDFFVLDEADRMLDMGFIHDVRKVIAQLPDDRQNLLFSATMPPKIIQLAGSFLHDPLSVSVTPTATTVDQIDQTVMFVARSDKRHLLLRLLKGDDMRSAIVFTRTKHGANRLAKQLTAAGVVAGAIHGNKSQGARTRTLNGFRSGEIAVLVATDLASRGIDVEDLTHVFNYELPNEPASYVHRIGRTGRAGKSGIAISFCDSAERDLLRDIEREIGQRVPVDDDHEFRANADAPAEPIVRGRQNHGHRQGSGNRQGGGQRGAGRGSPRGRRSGRGQSGRGQSGWGDGGTTERSGQSGGRRRSNTRTSSGGGAPSFGGGSSRKQGGRGGSR